MNIASNCESINIASNRNIRDKYYLTKIDEHIKLKKRYKVGTNRFNIAIEIWAKGSLITLIQLVSGFLSPF